MLVSALGVTPRSRPHETKITQVRTKKIKYPKWLTDVHARNYWRDHAPGLIAAGALTAANADLFAQLCEVWGEMRRVDKSDSRGRVYFIALLKQFQALTKRFTADKKQPESLKDILNNFMGEDAE